MKVCSCYVRSDIELEHLLPKIKQLLKGEGKISNEKIVNMLGELEETDHKRTCDWYTILLETCEVKYVMNTLK